MSVEKSIEELKEIIQNHEAAIAHLQEAHASNKRRFERTKKEVLFLKTFGLMIVATVVTAIASIKYEDGSLSYVFASENVRSLIELGVFLTGLLGGSAYFIKKIEIESDPGTK